ncbi:PQQ-like beta-propeller repeat protein, partial [Candidatus Bathyarchaeota archaeon]|nr:PQQ-like beta-propeller repeat protein [Candidatus Bathyarchaeota archaeon]
ILVGITDATVSALYGWTGITVTVTKPDNKIETLNNGGKGYTTDSTGMTGVVYTPNMVGNYTLQMHFPEQVVPVSFVGLFGGGIPANTTMLASDSIVITLVVQEEHTQQQPGYPLPTEYWTRPVDDQLREWSSIDGNWLQTPPNFLAFGNDQAPQSAHILWTVPLTSGGQVGGTLDPSQEILTQTSQSGQSGQVGYDTGDAYEGKWGSSFGGGAPMILGGKLYYQKYAGADPIKETICVDLHTGKQLWSRVLGANTSLTRGQLFYWQTYDFYGVYDYLWVATGGSFFGPPMPGTWTAYDPYTGDYVYTLTGVPGGTTIYGPHGELLILTLDATRGLMTMWNSSNIPALTALANVAPFGAPPNMAPVIGSMGFGQWEPMGKTVNATGPANTYINYNDGRGYVPYNSPLTPTGLNGYTWNVTIPKGLPGSARMAVAQDKIVGGVANTTDVINWAIDLRPGREGQLLYNVDWKAPSDWLAGNQTIGFGATSFIDKVTTVNAKESRYRYGFSTETGQYLWTISEPIAMLGHLTGGPSGENGYIVYGMLICGTMSGVVQAFNVTNGQLVWTYNVKDPYMQALWSNNWPVGHLIAANGMIYFANLEHSGNQPLPRGGPFVALNATTGDVIWRANGLFRQTVWGGRAVIGDSIIATMDTYDQRVYAIGKGPSATTVSIQNDVTTLGNSVMIKGTVTDISPGTNEYALTARFPSGVPAVSDASMSDWMLYVYKQFPRPANATGVEVTLDALDPNGNFVHIGTATSDASGTFSYIFTPEVPGKYTVIATFAGSESYYASYAETAVGVSEAPAAPAAPEPAAPLPPFDLYILGATVAIIAAVAIVGLMILRKKP